MDKIQKRRNRKLNKNIKPCVFISMGSEYLNHQYIKHVVSKLDTNAEPLTLIFLDSLELINKKLIEGKDPEKSKQFINERIKYFKNIDNINTLSFQENFAMNHEYNLLFKEVYTTYEHDSKFQSKLDNQTYINLTPKLRKLGIKNKRHPIIKKLSIYLIKEIALILYIGKTKSFNTLIFPQEKMDLLNILENKNESFKKYISFCNWNKIPFQYSKEHLLEVKNLFFTRSKKQILSDINMHLDEGEILGIVGINGVGKSTFLNILGGHLKHTQGKIFLQGQNISALSPKARNISTVFQGLGLFPNMSVASNILFAPRHTKKLTKQKQTELLHFYLEAFELQDKENIFPHELSGGEKQKVAIARSLASESKLLLLDEPVSALDYSSKLKFLSKLKTIIQNNKTSSLLVSHDPNVIRAICDKVAVIDRSNIVELGDPKVLSEKPKHIATAKALSEGIIFQGKNIENQFISNEHNLSLQLPVKIPSEYNSLLLLPKDITIIQKQNSKFAFEATLKRVQEFRHIFGLTLENSEGFSFYLEINKEHFDINLISAAKISFYWVHDNLIFLKDNQIQEK